MVNLETVIGYRMDGQEHSFLEGYDKSRDDFGTNSK